RYDEGVNLLNNRKNVSLNKRYNFTDNGHKARNEIPDNGHNTGYKVRYALDHLHDHRGRHLNAVQYPRNDTSGNDRKHLFRHRNNVLRDKAHQAAEYALNGAYDRN